MNRENILAADDEQALRNPKVREIICAANEYLATFENRLGNGTMDDLEARIQDAHRKQTRLMRAVGFPVKQDNFEDDDVSWHWGQTPQEVEEEWMERFGKAPCDWNTVKPLKDAVEGFIEYRDANTLNFQLEKADDFINKMRVALEGFEPEVEEL